MSLFNGIITRTDRANAQFPVVQGSVTQGSVRHKNSTKPSFTLSPPRFYHCKGCQRLLIEPHVLNCGAVPTCCGEPMIMLAAETPASASDRQHLPAIRVSGGFNSNSLTVNVGEPTHPMKPDHYIVWIYLYSFQGGQFKFLSPGEASSVTFALADKDAYVYCDRPVCKGADCKFNCKRGFSVWAYCSQHGLWHSHL